MLRGGMEMCNGMDWALEGAVGRARTIVRERLETAARAEMSFAAIERGSGIELLVVKCDVALDHAAVRAKVLVQTRGQGQLGILFWNCANMNAGGFELFAFAGVGRVR